MIRPIDIQEKEFSKAVRGYKEEEVNKFLDEITVDLDRLLNELRETKEENSRLVAEVERIRKTESNVSETLKAAKSLMAEISESAEKRAEILIKNAELDAELTVRNAREEAETLRKEMDELKVRYREFRSRYMNMLKSELQRFESSSGEELPELGISDFNDLPVGLESKKTEQENMRNTIQTIK